MTSSKTFKNDEARLRKNSQISETRKATKERRAQMKCQVFHLKITLNKTSRQSRDNLQQVFNQAKWVRNHILSLDEISDYTPSKTVPVKTPEGYEERELTLLGSQVKQSVLEQIKGDIKALSAAKEKGRKVGKLKFVRSVDSLNLKQVGSTYRFNKRMNRVKIQGLPGWYFVRGADQFSGFENYELANAKLLRKAGDYYVAVTVYSSQKSVDTDGLVDSLGVDFGVKTHFTLSDGREFNVRVVETERLRRLQRKLARQIKGSNNSNKTRVLIQREYGRLDRLKDEAASKFVSGLLKEAKVVYFQDDNFASWKSRKGLARGGKAVQHGVLGRVKQKMIRNPDRFLRVERFAPTTKTCVCGVVSYGLSLGDRWFACSACGHSAPRDVHAAGNMINFYTPAERGEALVEETSDSIIELSPMKQETDNFAHAKPLGLQPSR